MKGKISEYFQTFFDNAQEDWEAASELEWEQWLSEKINADLDDEYSLLNICQSYLFAALSTEEKNHQELKRVLYGIPWDENELCAIQTVDAIADMADAREEKDVTDCAKHGINSLLYFFYSRKYAQLKNALRCIRGEDDDCPVLYFFMIQCLKLLLSVTQSDFPFMESVSLHLPVPGGESKAKKLTPYAAALLVRVMRKKQIYTPAIPYAKFSLRITDSTESMEAFNSFGFCALYLGDYQLVYDIYYSWIHQKMVGKLVDVPKIFSESEPQWRIEHDGKQAIMYGNMAYICTVMCHMLPREDEKNEKFMLAAYKYIKLARSLRPRQDAILRSYADICYDMGEYRTALGYLKRSKQSTDDGLRKLLSMQRSIGIQLELLCGEEQRQEGVVEEFAREDKDNKDRISVSDVLRDVETFCKEYAQWCENGRLDELPYGEYLAEIWQAGQKLMPDAPNDGETVRNQITVLLLCIYNTAWLIRQQLRCKNYIRRDFYLRDEVDAVDQDRQAAPVKQIAYYTSMNNLQFLLSRVYCESDDSRPVSLSNYKEEHKATDEIVKQAERDAKNCFTMMHAYYMNDPNEGLTLLNELSEEISENGDVPNLVFHKLSPVVFREQLYDGQFVFLKSFTNVIDQLNMWSMYASDRSEGSDSNGCCVCIAPETFDMMVDRQTDSEQMVQRAGESQDDYQLYEVAYVHNGEIVGGNRPLKKYYSQLKELFVILNKVLCQHRLRETSDMETVHSILQQSLAPIVFLFKDASYRAEQERRIVVTRRKVELDRISKTAQNPPKLFINPYHQVYVEQLILGPKVQNPDHWIPYLQYELTKMWGSWPKGQHGERRPVVRKSSIHYRD